MVFGLFSFRWLIHKVDRKENEGWGETSQREGGVGVRDKTLSTGRAYWSLHCATLSTVLGQKTVSGKGGHTSSY